MCTQTAWYHEDTDRVEGIRVADKVLGRVMCNSSDVICIIHNMVAGVAFHTRIKTWEGEVYVIPAWLELDSGISRRRPYVMIVAHLLLGYWNRFMHKCGVRAILVPIKRHPFVTSK